MFCYQCQETTNNQNCYLRGVCGKSGVTASLQDMLVFALKGLSVCAVKAREVGESDADTELFVAQALFATLSNVNFDDGRIVELIVEALDRRDQARGRFFDLYEAQHGEAFTGVLPEAATWYYVDGTQEEFEKKGETVGIDADPTLDADLRSLRELIIYGLKGLAAYTEHAAMLDNHRQDLLVFLQEALAFTTRTDFTVAELVGKALECGKYGVDVMAALDETLTTRYGHPEPTQVALGVVDGPGILISGHDLRDLEDLLEQTMGTGINIYTHGEMLPA
ncbi:MAG: hypothetical protein KDD84_21540, partial [Caldilineaceae bacterium]|nr:hypothetical protein [Caldilineaceae bacterium]